MDDSSPVRSRVYLLWVVPVTFLVGVSLWLALSHGGISAKDWAFPAIVLGVVGGLVAWRLGYPRRPRQVSLTVLALFAVFAVWTLASNLWAADTGVSWPATARTFFYLLVLALALAYLTSTNARAAFKYLLMGASLFVLVAVIWRLWMANDLSTLFLDHRLVYPVGDADAVAALFLLPFWPLVWLAAGPRERAPVRGAAIGLATGMVALALMTQSRAAAWSVGISLVFIFALAPARLRLLFHVVIPALLMVYAFPLLDRYWTQTPPLTGGGQAARTLTVAVLAAAFIGMIVALLESWVKVSGRMKLIFGSVILLACACGLVYGGLNYTAPTGGPVTWFEDAWSRLAAEPAGGSTATGDQAAAPSTRADVWRTGWQDFVSRPALGAGVDQAPAEGTTAADGLTLRILDDTGVVGGVFAFSAILLSAAAILWPRTRAGWRWIRRERGEGAAKPTEGEKVASAVTAADAGSQEERCGPVGTLRFGWQISLLAALVLWFAQANMEGLWQATAVTVPALLVLAAALAATDARAGTVWPRIQKGLRRSGRGTRTRRARRLHGRLRPDGPLSQTFRVGLGVLSAAVVVLAVSAYLLAAL